MPYKTRKLLLEENKQLQKDFDKLKRDMLDLQYIVEEYNQLPPDREEMSEWMTRSSPGVYRRMLDTRNWIRYVSYLYLSGQTPQQSLEKMVANFISIYGYNIFSVLEEAKKYREKLDKIIIANPDHPQFLMTEEMSGILQDHINALVTNNGEWVEDGGFKKRFIDSTS